MKMLDRTGLTSSRHCRCSVLCCVNLQVPYKTLRPKLSRPCRQQPSRTKPAFVESSSLLRVRTSGMEKNSTCRQANVHLYEGCSENHHVIAVDLVVLSCMYIRDMGCCFQAAQLPPTPTILLLHITCSDCFLLLSCSPVIGALWVRRRLLMSSFRKTSRAVAAVKKRQLKAGESTQCNAADLLILIRLYSNGPSNIASPILNILSCASSWYACLTHGWPIFSILNCCEATHSCHFVFLPVSMLLSHQVPNMSSDVC